MMKILYKFLYTIKVSSPLIGLILSLIMFKGLKDFSLIKIFDVDVFVYFVTLCGVYSIRAKNLKKRNYEVVAFNEFAFSGILQYIVYKIFGINNIAQDNSITMLLIILILNLFSLASIYRFSKRR